MIFGALLLALVGAGTSIMEPARRRRVGLPLVLLSWVVLGVAARVGYGLAPIPLAVAGLAAALMMLSLRRARSGAVAVVVLAAVLMLTSGLTVSDGPGRAAALLSTVASPLVDAGWDATVLAVAVGLVLFLGDAGNRAVRCVLDLAGTDGDDDDGVRAVQAALGVSPRAPFRGGRFVGAIERWLLVALFTTSVWPVAVALLAAKGVVRFPEVSRDSDGGFRAEYFLVGTLTSVALALAAAGYLSLAR